MKIFLKVLIIISLITIIWFGLFKHLQYWLHFDSNTEKSFSAINSLFAALAFAGIILTIYLQQQELSLQRKELSDTRKEFELQNQTLKKQRFESTFFNLLNLHHTITERIRYVDSGNVHQGRDAIRNIYLNFVTKYNEVFRKNQVPELNKATLDLHRQMTTMAYSENYLKFEEHIGHYFRNFVAMANFTKVSDLISDEERKIYFNILRSQLNSYEVVLHFYNFHVGFAAHEKELFNDLVLGSILFTGHLPDVKHSFLFDPPHVVEIALRTK